MPTFGRDFEENWPNPVSPMPISSMGRRLLEKCRSVPKPDRSKANINDLLTKSANFPIEFGTNTCRVKQQPRFRYAIIEQQMASAYPLIHERVLRLYMAFLEHKIKFGTEIEQGVYSNFSLMDFVQRLLALRCAAFFDSVDNWCMVNGVRGVGGFDKVGSDKEENPLHFRNCLSFDEIKLAAFLCISSTTPFINNGGRHNDGGVEKEKTLYENEGVLIGWVGPRLDKPFHLDSQDLLISEEQNTLENFYGRSNFVVDKVADFRRIWTKFYDKESPLFDEIKDKENGRYASVSHSNKYFDLLLLKRRYVVAIDTLLMAANSRGLEFKRQVYLHVSNMGLSLWKISDMQTKVFVETFLERVKVLLPKLNRISVIHFAEFHSDYYGVMHNHDMLASRNHPDQGITICFALRNLADKLPEEYRHLMLVASYDADANALPGNEFWVGKLNSSSNSAAACCSIIAELQNPHINSTFVNAYNLHIATTGHGILHITDYCHKLL